MELSTTAISKSIVYMKHLQALTAEESEKVQMQHVLDFLVMMRDNYIATGGLSSNVQYITNAKSLVDAIRTVVEENSDVQSGQYTGVVLHELYHDIKREGEVEFCRYLLNLIEEK